MILPTPVTFPVIKDGETITATVIEQIDIPFVVIFRVHFSDGYEGTFGFDDSTEKVIGSEAGSGTYAKALLYDLPQVIDLDTTHFWHVFQHEIDGELLNVWVTESRYEGQTIYMVAYRNEFRLALIHKDGKWEYVETSHALTETDHEIKKRTGFMLDSLL